MNKYKISFYPALGIFFGTALILRLIYSFYLQQYFSGGFKFTTPDTASFIGAFQNLIDHGRYCFDLQIKDSCFYRLPTYSFFIGIQKYIIGSHYWISVAILQSILDAASCCLALLIARSLGFSKIALVLIAAIFFLYPFTIFWVPVQVPEVVGVFLTLSTLWFLICIRNQYWASILTGLTLVLAVWTKQYIAALVPAMVFFVMARASLDRIVRMLVITALAFVCGYSPWVLRNIINYGEPAVLMGASTGVRAHMPDFNNAAMFVSLFYENPQSQLNNIVFNGKLDLPDSEFYRTNKDFIENVAFDAFNCGPSFREWRGKTASFSNEDCGERVAEGFRELTIRAKNQLSFWEYYRTGFEAFQKGFFKINYLERTGSQLVQSALFAYRGFLIVLALLAIFMVNTRRQRMFVLGANFYWFSTLLVLSFVYRHLEMRYLLMADAVMLICSGFAISWVIERGFRFTFLKIKNAKSAAD